MLTEYSNYNDIRAFRNKVLEKYAEMKRGWLGKKIDRQMIEWKRNKEAVLKGFFVNADLSFKVDHQNVYLRIFPAFHSDKSFYKETFGFTLYTFVETNRGRLRYLFTKSHKEIHIYTPHFQKRFDERHSSHCIPDVVNGEYIPYIRNGRKYELFFHEESDSVCVARRIEDDIIMFITFLHRDMCTGNNYQHLLEQAGQSIDLYEWV